MTRQTGRRGFALLLVLGAGITMLFLVAVFSQMGQGVRQQMMIFNKKHQIFLIANYAYSKTMGELYSRPWLRRVFKDAPYEESASYGGGKYDLFVEDSPGQEMMVDIYVKSTLQKKSTLFFWRCKYNDDLLDFMPNNFFGEFPLEDFPQPGNRPLVSKVEQMLEKRRNNEDKANELGRSLAKATSLTQVISVLGGDPSSVPPDETGTPPVPDFYHRSR